jgi:hypothetical protein
MSRAVGFLAAFLATLGVASVAAATWSTLNEEEAKKELNAARIRATECSKVSRVTGSGKLKVTIDNSGHPSDITMVSVPPGMDEPTDACVRAEFQKIRVTPFTGYIVVVSGGFVLL